MTGQHEDFIPYALEELLKQFSNAESYSINNPLQEKTSNKLIKLSKINLRSPKQWIQSVNLRLSRKHKGSSNRVRKYVTSNHEAASNRT